MKLYLHHRLNTAGNSLISIMVGIAILGVLTQIFLNSMNGWTKSNESISQRMDLEELRRYIRIGADCTNTMTSITGCTAGNRVNIKKSDNTNMIGTATSPFPKIGKYYLKANCDSQPRTIKFYWSLNQSDWKLLYSDLPFVLPNPCT